MCLAEPQGLRCCRIQRRLSDNIRQFSCSNRRLLSRGENGACDRCAWIGETKRRAAKRGEALWRFCKPSVEGSIPPIGSILRSRSASYGWRAIFCIRCKKLHSLAPRRSNGGQAARPGESCQPAFARSSSARLLPRCDCSAKASSELKHGCLGFPSPSHFEAAKSKPNVPISLSDFSKQAHPL